MGSLFKGCPRFVRQGGYRHQISIKNESSMPDSIVQGILKLCRAGELSRFNLNHWRKALRSASRWGAPPWPNGLDSPRDSHKVKLWNKSLPAKSSTLTGLALGIQAELQQHEHTIVLT
jgi:hypothetical protein